MKNFAPFFLCLLMALSANSQVGINTTQPQATLDVNGTFRIQQRSSDEMEAVKVMGVTDNGVMVELDVSDNIYIKNNTLMVRERTMDIGTIPVIGGALIHNLSMILFPGGANRNKTIIKLETLGALLTLTGLDITGFATPMDAHGLTVWLYPTTSDLTMLSNNILSLPQNRFQLKDNNPISIKQFEMIRMMYDGELERWVVMSKH